jgi:hypothetical protein
MLGKLRSAVAVRWRGLGMAAALASALVLAQATTARACGGFAVGFGVTPSAAGNAGTALTDGDVSELVAKADVVSKCYEERFPPDGDRAFVGRLRYELTVDRRGRVSGLERADADRSAEAQGLARCFERRMRRLRFPAEKVHVPKARFEIEASFNTKELFEGGAATEDASP